MHVVNNPEIKSADEKAEYALFNFRWQRTYINELHKLAKYRGISASAIIKKMLLTEFNKDGIFKKEYL